MGGEDAERLKSAVDALRKAVMKIGEETYGAAGSQGGEGGQQGQGGQGQGPDEAQYKDKK